MKYSDDLIVQAVNSFDGGYNVSMRIGCLVVSMFSIEGTLKLPDGGPGVTSKNDKRVPGFFMVLYP